MVDEIRELLSHASKSRPRDLIHAVGVTNGEKFLAGLSSELVLHVLRQETDLEQQKIVVEQRCHAVPGTTFGCSVV